MLTEKSDVYSLGIVFRELLTGMQLISHGRNIVTEVHAACQSGLMSNIIDKNLGPYSLEFPCLKLGFRHLYSTLSQVLLYDDDGIETFRIRLCCSGVLHLAVAQITDPSEGRLASEAIVKTSGCFEK
ncbi:hypothetical protein LWI28_028355 [Acer negundo]|uniref:Uncharacterized protein n=1 Tax=Acer negundo TaxID=4023 RepID=A0AAD5NFT8_ACENE|nr:hypothetical protein LWI28_028355 [Acer negundo]